MKDSSYGRGAHEVSANSFLKGNESVHLGIWDILSGSFHRFGRVRVIVISFIIEFVILGVNFRVVIVKNCCLEPPPEFLDWSSAKVVAWSASIRAAKVSYFPPSCATSAVSCSAMLERIDSIIDWGGYGIDVISRSPLKTLAAFLRELISALPDDKHHNSVWQSQEKPG